MGSYSHGANVYCPLASRLIGACVNYTDDIIEGYDCKYKTCGFVDCQLQKEYPIGKEAEVKIAHHFD